MLGFMPGFPYLGGLDAKLHTHWAGLNLESKLTLVLLEWQIIKQVYIYGLTWWLADNLVAPIKVFDLNRTPMTLYEAGDYIQFYSINYQEFEKYQTILIKENLI